MDFSVIHLRSGLLKSIRFFLLLFYLLIPGPSHSTPRCDGTVLGGVHNGKVARYSDENEGPNRLTHVSSYSLIPGNFQTLDNHNASKRFTNNPSLIRRLMSTLVIQYSDSKNFGHYSRTWFFRDGTVQGKVEFKLPSYDYWPYISPRDPQMIPGQSQPTVYFIQKDSQYQSTRCMWIDFLPGSGSSQYYFVRVGTSLPYQYNSRTPLRGFQIRVTMSPIRVIPESDAPPGF